MFGSYSSATDFPYQFCVFNSVLSSLTSPLKNGTLPTSMYLSSGFPSVVHSFTVAVHSKSQFSGISIFLSMKSYMLLLPTSVMSGASGMTESAIEIVWSL